MGVIYHQIHKYYLIYGAAAHFATSYHQDNLAAVYAQFVLVPCPAQAQWSHSMRLVKHNSSVFLVCALRWARRKNCLRSSVFRPLFPPPELQAEVEFSANDVVLIWLH
jgi:hypothetical protein